MCLIQIFNKCIKLKLCTITFMIDLRIKDTYIGIKNNSYNT